MYVCMYAVVAAAVIIGLGRRVVVAFGVWGSCTVRIGRVDRNRSIGRSISCGEGEQKEGKEKEKK